ncbi:uncharacterized protein EDB91DRAFT_1172037 [Suillus paluster]|uniref:uncharacterized protein n=1 Tax=Suillus paluster TaxID=48578 RepID=UPI001B8793D1|nr:uncharacterized protein EDB91DRAFT_1172037 [Suillus paluster]KAG1723776.1 hypothetical protein EDB91DRAFT_1172037 [Suillus paluster]
MFPACSRVTVSIFWFRVLCARVSPILYPMIASKKRSLIYFHSPTRPSRICYARRDMKGRPTYLSDHRNTSHPRVNPHRHTLSLSPPLLLLSSPSSDHRIPIPFSVFQLILVLLEAPQLHHPHYNKYPQYLSSYGGNGNDKRIAAASHRVVQRWCLNGGWWQGGVDWLRDGGYNM